MDSNSADPVPKNLRPLTDTCTTGCSRPVDLRKRCMVWPNGRVAHVECFNRARLAEGRPAAQLELGASL